MSVLERLEARVRGYGRGRALVAFSGGVDSSVVLAVAARALGPENVEGVTAVSPSFPSGELSAARRVAAGFDVAHRTIQTFELDREAYARNDGQRCFHCKVELYATIERLTRNPDPIVLAGANRDDVDDVRPGLLAAERWGVRNPLLEEGLRKEAVRGVARELGLPVADKPAMACLSSRVAFGVRITPELLSRIDRAERAVRALGYQTVRVRHFGSRASIEVEPSLVARFLNDARLDDLVERVRDLGWEDVSIDRAGYRPGRMNVTLSGVGGPTEAPFDA